MEESGKHEESMIDSVEFQLIKLREARDLLSASFDLLLDEITGPEWLGRLANLANCKSVTCAWWPAGCPDKHLSENFGPKIDVPADFFVRLEHFVTTIAPDEPGIIDVLADQAGIRADAASQPLFTPDLLIAGLDWEPARVFFLFHGRKVAPNWQLVDHRQLAYLLPIVRKSIDIKKQLSRNADSIELASKINDDSSRGFITMMPDRTVVATNRLSNEILSQRSPIRLRGGKLEFFDAQLQSEFELQLTKIAEADGSNLSSFSWYKNVGQLSDTGNLLLTMRAFCLDSWRRESATHETTVVITLEKMEQNSAIPGVIQLREFFNLTTAQARLVTQLTQSSGVEDAASALNISVNTARSHLRAIYSRVGVSNKAELLQRVGSTMVGHIDKL